MGYPDNEIIEQQVELGDRVPAPRPAYQHIAWDTRANRKKQRAHAEKIFKGAMRRQTGFILTGVFYGALIGFILGVLVGWSL